MADLGTLMVNLGVDTSGLDSANRGVQGLERQVASSADRMISSLRKVAAVAGLAFSVNAIKNHIVEVTRLAGTYEQLGTVMTVAGKNAGYTATEMFSFETALKKAGIAAVESRRTLVSLATANIDLSKASKLARAAQDLAVVGGINSSQAFERLTQGIKSAEVEILRTIGLNVSFEDSYKKMAAQLGKNANSLTQVEKTQARVNEVLQEATKYAGIYSQSMGHAEKQMGSLQRHIDDYRIAFGNAFQPAYMSYVQAMTDSYKRLTEVVSNPRFQLAMMEISDFFMKTFSSSVSSLLKAIEDNIDEITGGLKNTAQAIEEIGSALGTVLSLGSNITVEGAGAIGGGILGRFIFGSWKPAVWLTIIALIDAVMNKINEMAKMDVMPTMKQAASGYQKLWEAMKWDAERYAGALKAIVEEWGNLKVNLSDPSSFDRFGEAVQRIMNGFDGLVPAVKLTKEELEAIAKIAAEDKLKNVSGMGMIMSDSFGYLSEMLGEVVSDTKKANTEFEALYERMTATIAPAEHLKQAMEKLNTEFSDSAVEARKARRELEALQRFMDSTAKREADAVAQLANPFSDSMVGEMEEYYQEQLENERQLGEAQKQRLKYIEKTAIEAYENELKEAEDYQKKLEAVYEEMLKNIQDFTADTFYDIFSGNMDGWEDMLDSMKQMFLRWLAEVAAAAVVRGIVVPVLFGSSGTGGSAAGLMGTSTMGGTGGGISGYIMSGLGLANTASSTIFGKSLVSMAFSYVSNALFGGATTTGLATGLVAGGTPMSTMFPVTGALYGTAPTAASTFGSGAGSGAGSLSGTVPGSAGSGYGALIVAAMIASIEILAFQHRGDAAITAEVDAAVSETAGRILDASLSAFQNFGFDEADAQGAAENIAKHVGQTIEMYNTLFANLSESSQKKIKEAMKGADLDFMVSQYAMENGPQIAAGTAIGNTMYALGEYFADYIDEAMKSILSKPIAGVMKDDVINNPKLTQEFYQKQLELYPKGANELVEFQKAFVDLMEKLAKAEAALKSFNEFVSGESSPFTVMDGAILTASVSAEAYANQMAALGKELSDEEKQAVFDDVLQGILATTASLDNLAKPMSLVDLAAIEASSAFSAYLSIMDEAGIDLAKLGDLEAKRAEVIARAQEQLLSQMWTNIESVISGLLGMTNESENAINNVLTQFQNIYKMLESTAGIADYTDEINTITAQLGDTSNMTADEIAQLTKTLDALKLSTAEYTKMKERELEVIKSTMGLGPSGQELRTSQIASTYGITGEDQARAAMDWFKNASWADIEAMAKTFGISTDSLIQDLAWMIENWDLLGEKANDIAAQQAASAAAATASLQNMLDQLNGVTEVDKIKERYGVQGYSDQELQGYIDMFASMSADELYEYLDALGMSQEEIEQFTEDILTLNDSFIDFHAIAKTLYDTLHGTSEIDRIKKTYGLESMSNQDLAGMIANFRNLSEETLAAYLTSLGMTEDEVKKLTADILSLNDVFKGTDDAIANMQDTLNGVGVTAYDKVISKYGLEGYTTSQLQELVKWFADVDPENLKAYLRSLGYTEEQIQALAADVLTLGENANAASDAVNNFRATELTNEIQRMQTVANNVANGLASINAQIAQLNWEISTGGGSADYFLEMYNTAMAIGDWEAAGSWLAKWYSAAKSLIDQGEDVGGGIGDVVDALVDLVDEIEDTINAIKYSDLNVGVPREVLAEAEQDYAQLLAAATATNGEGYADADAAREFMAFARTYLESAQDAYKSSEAYQAIYAKVMQDLENLESYTFVDPNAGTPPGGTPPGGTPPDYTAINEQFLKMSQALIDAMTHANNEMYLNINWDDFEGDMATALSMLQSIVHEYGWINEFTLEWVTKFGRWTALQTIADQLRALKFIVDESGGWSSTATLTFIAALTGELATQKKLTDLLALFHYIIDESGIHSEATLNFVRAFSGSWTFENLDDVWAQLKNLGIYNETTGEWDMKLLAAFALGLQDQYGSTVADVATWLTAMGLDKNQQMDIFLLMALQKAGTDGMDSIEEVNAWVASVMATLQIEDPTEYIDMYWKILGKAGLTEGIDTTAEVLALANAFIAANNITDRSKQIQVFWDLLGMAGLTAGIDTQPEVLALANQFIFANGISDRHEQLQVFWDIAGKAGLTSGLNTYDAINNYVNTWLSNLGIDDINITREVTVNLVFNLVGSGQMTLTDLADWIWAAYMNAWTAASDGDLSAANAFAADVEALASLYGQHNTSGLGAVLAMADANTGGASAEAIQDWIDNDLYPALGGRPHYWAEGGVVSSPTLGWVGEAGYPEAVIPMMDGINIPVKWVNGSSTGAEYHEPQPRSQTIIIQVGNKEFEAEIKSMADDVIVARAKRGKTSDTRKYYRA